MFIDVTIKEMLPFGRAEEPPGTEQMKKGQYRLEENGEQHFSILWDKSPWSHLSRWIRALEQHAPCFEFMEDFAWLWKSSFAQSQKMQSLGIPGAEMCQPLPLAACSSGAAQAPLHHASWPGW